MRIDVYHHHCENDELNRKLDDVLGNQRVLERKVDRMARTVDEFRNALSQVDAETTRIAAKIDELLARIQTGGLTDAEEEQVFTELASVTGRLKEVGKDPDNPVPNPTP